ncbi:MAG: T9SS type A sorting domain-containing protein, partial [Ignavibacteria bacterium]|nr:T9SS type A sorting domain-containing protein [Ignavibacteria bacterium]
QNYPNPFNAATVIGYKLQVTSFVSIKIYDIKGNEIVSLVNKQMETGEHRVEWNAENVPSGMYFYRLTANNFSETKKLLLLK